MIYFDSSALLKFIKPEKESRALREWRVAQLADSELVTSQLAVLEISRTLLRAGVDHQRVPYVAGQAVRGLFLIDVTSTVLTRARSYGIRRLGSLDAIHLATADPFLSELTGLVTYDAELASAAGELGLPVASPARSHESWNISPENPGRAGRPSTGAAVTADERALSPALMPLWRAVHRRLSSGRPELGVQAVPRHRARPLLWPALRGP